MTAHPEPRSRRVAELALPHLPVALEERRRHLGSEVRDHVDPIGSGPLRPGRVPEPVPERRVWLLERLQDHRDLSIGVFRPPVVEHVAGQALEHDLEDLPVDLLGLQVVEVEEGHLVGHDPPPHPEVEPAPGELIEHAHLLDEPERVVERQAVHARPEPDAPGALGGRGQEDPGHRSQAERRRMVLGQVVGVEAGRVVLLEQPEAVLVEVRHRDVPAVEVVEDAQVHIPSRRLQGPAWPVWWRDRQVGYHGAVSQKDPRAGRERSQRDGL